MIFIMASNIAIRVPYRFTIMVMTYWMFISSAIAETRVEVFFTKIPVTAGGQTAFQCNTWDVGPSQGVGISRYINGGSSVLVRNGALLPSVPDNIFFDILPPQPDGSTPYRLTIAGVDEATDSGLYSCTVLTMVGAVDAVAAASAMLEVIPAPDVYLPPEEYPKCSLPEEKLSYYAGDSASLICTSLDGKPPISLVWLRNNEMKIPENQTTHREGTYIVTTLMETLREEDNGVIFTCVVISDAFNEHDRRCSIGPIAVWESNAGTTNSTGDGMEPGVTRILGLTLTLFVIIVVAAGTILLILIIICIAYCVRVYSCSCMIKRKSYSMDGQGDKESTIVRRDGTLSAGDELQMQYVPTRTAPAAPPTPQPPPPTYNESLLDSLKLQLDQQESQRPYEKNITSATGGNKKSKRLSTVETALLLAVTKSLTRKQGRAIANSRDSARREAPAEDDDVIYANTSRSSSVVDLSNIIRDDDEDSGVVNTGYDDGNDGYPVFENDPEAPTSSSMTHSRSFPQFETIYHNTAELPDHTKFHSSFDEIPQYAKVDKSRTSTMESVKKEKHVVTPEAVTTLDADVIYHNTADLGLTLSIDPSPPPIPKSDPVSHTSKTAPQKPDYKRQMSSTSLGRPSFKPPPPPSADRPSSIYQNTDDIVDAGSKSEDPSRPMPPPKPVPPKKPNYDI